MPRTVWIALLPMIAGADWPQHLGPHRDGHSVETGLSRSWPKDGPPRLWQKEVGLGWAAPVVAGDRLIVFHRVDGDEVVECLDPATGKQTWKASYRTRYVDDFGFDDGPRSTPLIADGKVFTLGANGDLRAWDLPTGKALWDRNVNKDYGVPKGYFGVATSPILVGGRLMVNVGAKKAGIVAFDPTTGKEIWKAGDDGASHSSPVAAKIAGDELAVFFTRAGLLAVAAETGDVKYTHPWRPRINASVNAATPVVVGDRMFVSTSYSTGAIVLEAGKGELKEVWSGDDSLSNHYSTPVHVDGFLYGVDGRQESGPRLRCIEFATGKVRWTKEGFGCTGLIAIDGLFVATPENGDAVLFETTASAYKELARTAVLDSPVRALPALANGRLFVRDKSKLIALNLMKK